MTRDDVASVVDVHMTAFPGFFLTFLGRGFLRELYRGIVSDPSGIAFVGERDGAIVGFVAGTSEPAGLYTRLLKRRFVAFTMHAAVAALRRPSSAPRLLRALSRPKEASAAPNRAELMSIAVLPGVQGGGVGARLVDAFAGEVARRGGNRIVLTTDAIGNDAVNAMYVKRGFTLSRTFETREGRRMNEYEKEIRS